MSAGGSPSGIERNGPRPGASLELGETRRLREADLIDRAVLRITPVDPTDSNRLESTGSNRSEWVGRDYSAGPAGCQLMNVG